MRFHIHRQEPEHQKTVLRHTRTQAIIVLELILYMLFGLVQLFQGFFPSGNRKIEAAYIILSLVAKFLLGVMLFANVMFT
jgi:hypothetical protein